MTHNIEHPVPKISVVICTYNRDLYIISALDSLAKQNIPKDNFEVLVIDNNSTDRTAQLTKAYIEAHKEVNIKYHFEAQKGLSFARNRGLQESSAPIVSYIDDDAEAVPDFLNSIIQYLNANPHVVGIGGKVIPKYENNHEPAWMNPFLNGFVGAVNFGDEALAFKGNMKYPAGCNMTYRRTILLQAGGFNNELTFRSDDKYIYYRVAEISSEIHYLPNALVYHNIDSSRLKFENFKRLFLKTGNEEKVRIRAEKGSIGLVKQFVIYSLKLAASLVLFLKYLIQNQVAKGKYIVFSQWYTWKGFLSAQVFVR